MSRCWLRLHILFWRQNTQLYLNLNVSRKYSECIPCFAPLNTLPIGILMASSRLKTIIVKLLSCLRGSGAKTGYFFLNLTPAWNCMGGTPKIVGNIPPNHPFVHRVFHYFHHSFWDTPIFGNPRIIFIFDASWLLRIFHFPTFPPNFRPKAQVIARNFPSTKRCGAERAGSTRNLKGG